MVTDETIQYSYNQIYRNDISGSQFRMNRLRLVRTCIWSVSVSQREATSTGMTQSMDIVLSSLRQRLRNAWYFQSAGRAEH